METKDSLPVVHRKVALIGNPNSGKSTLFNALTGLHQKTGNFPGVTVDKKTANVKLEVGNKIFSIHYTDLPGTYSLYPKSLDEEVATWVLTEAGNADQPDLVVIVADATNLKRSLFLAGQIIDLNIPCILALNMIDEAEKANFYIDKDRLSNRLGISVVAVSARHKTGIDELEKLICGEIYEPAYRFIDPSNIAEETQKLIKKEINPDFKDYQALHKAHRLFEKDKNWQEKLAAVGFSPSAAQAEESLLRYSIIGEHIAECTGKKAERPPLNKKLDRILTHKVWGYVFFLFIMVIVFQSIFFLAKFPMDWIQSGFGLLRGWCVAHFPAGILTDLFVNGILAGLSGVVVFIPQIALLFFFIGLLEDSGYMARVTFIMDKLMRRIGLHGRSVIPLMSGMACAVPAIMSTRTISNWKERIITIMVTPLMSCSARLPVYTLLISLVIPNKIVGGIFNLQGLALMGMYLLGFLSAIMAAWVISKIIKAKEKSWFIMELPVYRMPKWSNVFYTIFEKVKVFLFDAGKIIVAIAVVLWVLSSYGPGEEFQKTQSGINTLNEHVPVNYAKYPYSSDRERLIAKTYETDSLIWDFQHKKLESKKLELSYAGRLGKFIEPAIKPIGFDWKIGISLITSLAAREVFVGTMSTIYGTVNLNKRMKEERDPVTGRPVYTLATGISLMLFYAFAMQCMSTIAVVRRETKSWKWPVIQFTYMGVLAYIASLIAYQLLK
ncbi:MAG TPA: ferrous iron transport protein B [Bacteroidia bacterium]|nr:ferrous iron transport protein B [Bacteroidia bacterium]